MTTRCAVDFTVEITASNPLVTTLLETGFLDQMARDQVRAFDQRCRQLPYSNQDDDDHA
jgi:ribosome-associated toxin RatA of RatAB toxin-antitoxin module